MKPGELAGSGLRSELQAKVVGIDGDIDEMVAKARFEETNCTAQSHPLTHLVPAADCETCAF